MTSGNIQLRFASADEVEINKREAFRYMGYKLKSAPEEIEGLFSFCLSQFKTAVSYKACFTKTKINFLSDGRLDFGFGEFKSLDLNKNLSGCNEAYIFAATCGAGVDRAIMRYGKTEPSKGVALDAIGSAAVEDWCNIINAEMKSTGETKPRFSPGYGDLELSIQPRLLEFLDAYRKIGISLSESLMMLPTKSVTAIVGVKG